MKDNLLNEAYIHQMNSPIDDWDRPPQNRSQFHNVASFLKTAQVATSSAPHEFEPSPAKLVDLELMAFLNKTYTNAFVVLHKGKLVTEHYLGTMKPEHLHLSQSVAKSFTGAMVGILANQGKLDLQTNVATYVPELQYTAYAGATAQHLLDMTSGVAFNEDYTNPYSDIGRVDVASNWKPIPQNSDPKFIWPKSMLEVILSLKTKEADHGQRYSYRSIETDVLALILERISKQCLPELLSQTIWQKAKMEANANYTVDATGFAIADGGLNACARDYARFGQLMLAGGNGIIPGEWITETRNGTCGNLQGSYATLLPHGGYHNQFWIEEPEHRALIARGVFGQMIYISWAYNLVAVKLSAWPQFVDIEMEAETLAMCHKIGKQLQ